MERSGAHNELGRQGETLAADFLGAKGYELLQANLTVAAGEIDLLCRDGETLVLVEVKTLRIARHFNPLEKIDWAKQKKLGLLAQIVAARYPERNVRVDAVTVYWLSGDDATAAGTPAHFMEHLVSQTALHACGPRYIVTEPYLGRPLRAPLEPKETEGWLRELSEPYLKFFETWQDADIEAMLVVFPAAKVRGGAEASLLNFLFDSVAAIGYAPKRLAQYARPNAYVARDLVRLTNA